MALPLLPILLGAAFIGGSAAVVRGLRKKSNTIGVMAIESKLIRAKWEQLGGERVVGKPITPVIASTAFKGIALQGFQRADGEKATIYSHTGGTFLVRGGFYKVYTGNELVFGLPTSDEYDKMVNAAERLGVKKATVAGKEQTFQKGSLIWLKKSGHVIGRAGGKVVYDSKPFMHKRAWYEDIGIGDALLLAVSPVAALNVGIGALVGPDVQKGILGKIPIVSPIAGLVYEGTNALSTYSCKGAGAVNASTGSGDPKGNALCRAYQNKHKEPSVAGFYGAATSAVKAQAKGGEGGEAAPVAGLDDYRTVARYNPKQPRFTRVRL